METSFEQGFEVPHLSLAQLHAIHLRGQELISKRESEARARLAHALRSLKRKVKQRAVAQARAEVKNQAIGLIRSAEELHRQVLEDARRDCASLAVTLAEQIIGANLKKYPEGLAKQVADALSQLSDLRGTKVSVHPGQVDKIRSELSEAGFGSTQIISNSEITIGDATIESSSGSLELSWRERLEILKVRIIATLSTKQ